jgi:hypothetical protein
MIRRSKIGIPKFKIVSDSARRAGAGGSDNEVKVSSQP